MPKSAAGTRVFKPFNSPGTALSATGSQYFRMGLINTAANQRGIVGRTAGVMSGVIEKTVAERNYMKSISASSSNEFKAKEPNTETNSEIKDKKGKDEK